MITCSIYFAYCKLVDRLPIGFKDCGDIAGRFHVLSSFILLYMTMQTMGLWQGPHGRTVAQPLKERVQLDYHLSTT